MYLYKHKAIPPYLLGLLASLIFTVLGVVLLRGLGFPVHRLAETGFRPYMMAYAVSLPLLALLLDFRFFKEEFLKIDVVDRSPLLLLGLAQVSWFFSWWWTVLFLIAYLALLFFRQVLRLKQKEDDTGYLKGMPTKLYRKATSIPLYIWCLVALFVLNLLGLLWQREASFPNTTDKYILYLLLPLSLFIYKPKQSSIQHYAHLFLSVLLVLLTMYFLYVSLFHLVYVEHWTAWLMKPLDRHYLLELTPFDSYTLYNDYLLIRHPSYVLCAIVPYFLLSFFPSKNQQNAVSALKAEHIAFVVLTILFVGVTHLRYGIYYVILMLMLWLYRAYSGAFKDFLRKNAYYLVLLFALIIGFLYRERALFVDNIRLELYEEAVRQIKAYLVLGQGTGAELRCLNLGATFHHAHAHNLLLSMMINFGLLGLMWTIVFILSLFHNGIQRNRILLLFLLFLMPLFIIEAPFTHGYIIYQMLMSFFLLSLINYKLD